MGRRSIHSPEELRELIIQATTEIVEENGLEGLSAREIAKRIGYSPGTLYNVFENLDDILLTIEARLLDRLADRLAKTDASGTPQERLKRLTETYFAFTQERPKLWNLLVEHRLPVGKDLPTMVPDQTGVSAHPPGGGARATDRREGCGRAKARGPYAVGRRARHDLAVDCRQARARHRPR